MNNNLYNKNISFLMEQKYLDKNKLLNYNSKYDVSIDNNKITFKEKERNLYKEEIYHCINFWNKSEKYLVAPFIFKDEFFLDNIKNIQIRYSSKNCPIYLYYEDLDKFFGILQIIDIKSILNNNYTILLLGIENLKNYFSNKSIKFPENYINLSYNDIKILNCIKCDRIEFLKSEIDKYYNSKDLRNIRHNFKILICHKYMYNANCEKFISSLRQGKITYEITSELNEFSSCFDEYTFLNYVYFFKPTALLVTNLQHRGFPYYINEKLIVISYLDYFLHIFINKQYLEMMGKYTFLLVNTLTLENVIDKDIQSLNVFSNNIISFPFVCSYNDFKKEYALNKHDMDKYGSDICMTINNTASIDINYLADFMMLRNESITGKHINNSKYLEKISCIIHNIIMRTYEETINSENLIWDIKWFRQILADECIDENLYISKEFEIFCNMLFINIIPNVYKCVVVEWIIDKGYNLKIWGNSNNNKITPRLKKYVKDYVKKSELPKLFNSSKICLGINPILSLHLRAFESILNNCFYLTCRFPNADFSDITTIFKKGKSIDFYSTKNELYNKIDYYLKNSDTRKEIVKEGKKLILEKKLYSDEVLKLSIQEVINRVEIEASSNSIVN